MRSKLIIVTSILLSVAAVFMVIFQIIRVNNIQAMIEYTKDNIDELKYIEEHIDEYNDIYAYEKLLSSNSLFVKNTSIMAALRNLWGYKLLIGTNDEDGKFQGVEITLDILRGRDSNNDDVDDLDEIVAAYDDGEIMVLRLEETLSKVSIPYSIVFSGNVCPDINDSLETFFRSHKTMLSKDVSLGNKKVYTEGEKQYVEVPPDRCNYIEYYFTKEEGTSVEFALFLSLAERLFPGISDEYGSISRIEMVGASYVIKITM
jgi:hypothetical protein